MSTVEWTSAAQFEDIRYELSSDGIAKITIDRPEVRNAFRPQTIVEISNAFELAREDPSVGAIILTGEGPLAFCSGGDQREQRVPMTAHLGLELDTQVGYPHDCVR